MNKNIDEILKTSLSEEEMPDKILINTVKNKIQHSSAITRRTTRTFRTVLIAAAFFVIATTTALAATGVIRIFEEKVPERADMSLSSDKGTDHKISFNSYDEIRDLFKIKIGNVYMENGKGNLFVVYPDDADAYASIESSFSFDDLNFAAWVRMSLDPENPTVQWDGWYGNGVIDPGKEGTVKFTYVSDKNGIEADVIHLHHGVNWFTEIRFYYEGAYYYVLCQTILQMSTEYYQTIEEVVKKFIDAFE